MSQFEVLVAEGSGCPHLPLPRLYQRFLQELSRGAARTYLMALLPYFSFLETDSWRQQRNDRWDSPPECVREAVRDYLLQRLHGKVRRHGAYELVALSAQSPSTVRVVLSALKWFYASGVDAGEYPHEHPLMNPVVHMLHEADQDTDTWARARPKMPPESGSEEPHQKYSSDNDFRLVHQEWKPEPIDDPVLHSRLVAGFTQAHLSRRDQSVIRMAYASGARITEILTLTVGDWRKRGAEREAAACNKGSHGRRVKVMRFSAETAKLLHGYVNEDRSRFDPLPSTFAQLSDQDPVFLSARRKPYGYAAFIPHWERLCKVIGMDLNVHGLRHWHVSQMMRLIHEVAETPGEVERRKEEMVRYMAWRSPDTLKAYEHYFQAIHHAQMQDMVQQPLDQQLKGYIEQAQRKKSSRPPKDAATTGRAASTRHQEVSWGDLVDLGGNGHD